MYKKIVATEIRNKGITRICHLTKSAKLLHILSSEDGILATHFLDVWQNDILTRNDERRFDGYTEYISCSVEYPNTWYLNRIRNQDSLFKEWVIIFIDPYIMCEDQTRFCHRNAAANYGAYIKSGIEGFNGMFAETVQGQKLITRPRSMLSCCPTDGQAEVLIYSHIPRKRILSIAVPTVEQAFIENERIKHIAEAPPVKWIIAPDLFNNNWHSMIMRGRVAEESVF